MHKRDRGNQEAGFTLVVVTLGILVMIGMMGLAIDLGRMYIAKGETQTFVDSASLAATLELDGTADGLSRARARVTSNGNKWNFNTTPFSSVTTTFAKDIAGPWETAPVDPSGYRYARAFAGVNVPVYFLGIFEPSQILIAPPGTAFIVTSVSSTVKVNAVAGAGQEPKTRFKEGLFPFSPYAHTLTGPDFGFVVGQLYTLRWASNPHLGSNTCPGDDQQSMLDLASAGGGSERGYIEATSADIIRATIEGDYQTAWRGVGDTVFMTGGAKQAQRTSLLVRVAQDTDSVSPNFVSYASVGIGNGRRIVGAPINSGYPDYRVVQIGAFFLRPANTYDQGGNSPWCAEYIGAWVQGSAHKGAGDPGAYVVRLSQ